LNLQASYDLEVAEDESSERIEQELLPAARRDFSLTWILAARKRFATFSFAIHKQSD
jgi:hypothetical protein